MQPADPPISGRPTFSAAELAAAVGGRLVHDGGAGIRGAAVDSRRLAAGQAFFALPGKRTDGHAFLADAVEHGAAALVVTRLPEADLLARLTAAPSAATAWRTRFEPLVVGVTGSLGKTSTKEQTAELLGERWRVLRNTANENNEIGLPLTLLRLGPEHGAAVVEMGMYVPGDISVLAAIARPRIGVVTAVRGTHLSRSGSIEAIEAGKRELVEALPDGGTAVLNADDARVSRMAVTLREAVSVLRYGFAPTADVSASEISSLAERGMRFVLRTGAGEVDIETPALGRHGVHNALAAAAVGLAVGFDLGEIAAGLARPVSAPHRSTLVDLGRWRVLDDSYNAAPDSMRAALDLLSTLPGRRVAVLGEMLELGETAHLEHVAVGEHAAGRADLLIAVGELADAYAEGARRAGMASAAITLAADRPAALDALLSSLRDGDVVLLKASRGIALELLLDGLRAAAGEGSRA
ncbi:MAG TPA: UDP-N-acetylmuramoyl-tripeptide--D-alanyl-D-alanine ligase [Candidatus Limnocylindria bacterium]|nr:UDP-N-acetylmuramoyl-tripeptide--D-alanyl-D-alanine ligase [Candidatus Limnocylindria bacterium]